MRNEKLVLKIIEKCMKLNSLGQDSFFSFSGHVKEIDIHVCKEKWKNIVMSKYKNYEDMHLANYRLYSNAYTSDTKKLKEIIEKLEAIEEEVVSNEHWRKNIPSKIY